MITTWQKLAVEAGFPGLRIVNTLGNFYQADAGTSQLLEASGITSSFHFWPQLMGGGFVPTSTTGSVENFDIPTETQYWGAFSGFDRRPRDPKDKYFKPRSVADFRAGLVCSSSQMSQDVARNIDTNLFFVTAWNEWNEQAVLEPSMQYGFGYLKAVHENLITVPARTPWDPRRNHSCCRIVSTRNGADHKKEKHYGFNEKRGIDGEKIGRPQKGKTSRIQRETIGLRHGRLMAEK
jgi:hypothetical protein